MWANETVRSKCVGVNSVFFVQLRKRWPAVFGPEGKIVERVADDLGGACRREFSNQGKGAVWNLIKWAAGISTEGTQEMQKGSLQLPVLSSQLEEL